MLQLLLRREFGGAERRVKTKIFHLLLAKESREAAEALWGMRETYSAKKRRKRVWRRSCSKRGEIRKSVWKVGGRERYLTLMQKFPFTFLRFQGKSLTSKAQI